MGKVRSFQKQTANTGTATFTVLIPANTTLVAADVAPNAASVPAYVTMVLREGDGIPNQFEILKDGWIRSDGVNIEHVRWEGHLPVAGGSNIAFPNNAALVVTINPIVVVTSQTYNFTYSYEEGP